MTLPTYLSLSRLLSAIFIALAYFAGPVWSGVLFLFLWAGITDFLDGWIARRYGLCTPFGAWLDHLSDKIVVGTTLIILALAIDSLGMHLACLLLINRELLALGVRSCPGLENSPRGGIQVHALGKLKTMLQFISLTLLLVAQTFAHWSLGPQLTQLGILFLLLATVFSYLGLCVYAHALSVQMQAHTADL